MPKLSILITAYNQTQLLRWNISTLLQNAPDDYEIVIQDDCSTEPVEELVQSFHDPRIRYYRNPVNYGHDRNVIEGFKNCKGEAVFLLRSSDTILPGKIRTILDFIERNPSFGYGRFSCLDENGEVRIRYRDSRFEGTGKTLPLNRTLLLHPSGELFQRKYLPGKDLDRIAVYLDTCFHDKHRYVINELLRDKLCMTAPFFLSKEIVWQYTRTVRREDMAENRNKNGICIFAPSYQYERLRCELHYISRECHGSLKEKKVLLGQIFDHYARMCIYDFQKINQDPEMQRHYGYEAIPFCSLHELKVFKKMADRFARELPGKFQKTVLLKEQKLTVISLLYWRWQDIRTWLLQRWKHDND